MRNTDHLPATILRRVAVKLIVALIVAVLIAIGLWPHAAHAEPLAGGKQPQVARQLLATEGVPASALPTCALNTGAQGTVGGWGFRDFVSSGSFTTSGNALEGSPIRPMGTRIGEPCYNAGKLTIPARYTDAPVPMLDANADGKDDGAPPAAATGAYNNSTSGSTTLQIMTSFTQRWKPSSVWHAYGMWCIKVTGSMTGLTIYGDFPSQSLASGVTAVPGTGAAGTYSMSANQQPTSTATWSGGTYTPSAGPGCPAGATAVLQTDVFKNATTGIDYPFRTLPTRIYLAPTGNPAAGVGGAAVAPVTNGVRYYGGTQGAKIAIPGVPPAGEPAGYVRCSSSYSASTTFDLPVDGVAGDGLQGGLAAPPTVVSGVATDWTEVENNLVRGYPYISPTDCPYLVAISMWVTTYQGVTEAERGSVLVEWSADRYRNHYSYNDGESEVDLVCTLYPESPGCYEILNPTYVDGTDFDSVCANAPEPAWLDFGWLPAFVGHYARCLFVPVNGFDRYGEVAAAWESSGGGQILGFATGFLPSFAVTGTCGVILPGANIMGTPLNIDSCGWSWAGPLKTFLYWYMLVFGLLFWIAFAANSIIGLVNKKTMSPFVKGGAE